jgi:hypothetical protein
MCLVGGFYYLLCVQGFLVLFGGLLVWVVGWCFGVFLVCGVDGSSNC